MNWIWISLFCIAFLAWGIYWSLPMHNKNDNEDIEIPIIDREDKFKQLDSIEIRVSYLEGRFQERDFLQSIEMRQSQKEKK